MIHALILKMKVHATTYQAATEQILAWADGHQSRTVFAANVHMVMEAYDDGAFRKVVNKADLVTPDGMPLVWMVRWLGHPIKDRVYGPTLMLRVLEAAARKGIPVGFYGGAPKVLDSLVKNLQSRFQYLDVVFSFSPPYRGPTPEEDLGVVQDINDSGARILFVGLGCPKQELWIAAHRDRVKAVMLGVGAAFDFHAGKVRQAPKWLQKSGLEWLFRLLAEPGRLWKRYLKHNPRFAMLGIMELARKKGNCI